MNQPENLMNDSQNNSEEVVNNEEITGEAVEITEETESASVSGEFEIEEITEEDVDSEEVVDGQFEAEEVSKGSGAFEVIEEEVETSNVEVLEGGGSSQDTPVTDALNVVFAEKITALEQNVKDSNEHKLRIAADFENYKRRTAREKEEQRKFANKRLLLDFIPVLDNLDRAIQHVNEDTDSSSLLDGVRMVQRQFAQALAKHGVTSFESEGQPFDPQKHEAVQQVPSEDHPNNTVINEFQKGYFLNDRLLRPAMVVVSTRPPSADD